MKKNTHLLSLLIIFCYYSAFATRYYVNQEAIGVNDGSSWTNAFTTLEQAITAANSGDEVWVAGSTIGIQVTLNIPDGVMFYGGFAGTETDLSQRDLSANATTLHGDVGTSGNVFDNIRIMATSNVGQGTVIDGFQFLLGCSLSSIGGGAILISNSQLVIRNCQFFFNHGGTGGALHVNGNSLVEVVNCQFRNNSTAGSPTNGGSAAYIAGGLAFFAECDFVQNISEGHGGAIRAEAGGIGIFNSRLSANASLLDGGAIYVSTADMDLANTLIVGNVSNTAGGSAFHAVPNGGSNSIFVRNCAITGNRNSFLGETTAFQANNLTTIANSIFWENSSTKQISAAGALDPAIRNCIIVGDFDGGDVLNVSMADPLFVSPGLGIEAPFSHEAFDYNLQLNSPGINAGDNTFVLGDFDLAGNPRLVGVVDIGPYEYTTLSSPESVHANLEYYYDEESDKIIFSDIPPEGLQLKVFDLSGRCLLSKKATLVVEFHSTRGIYILKMNDFAIGKILVR